MLIADQVDALVNAAEDLGEGRHGVEELLSRMTQAVLERALETEMSDNLGYTAGDPVGIGTGDSRNGKTTKSVQTLQGPVQLTVPRDRNGSFEPVIVPKRTYRLGRVEDMILSLYARGMTTRDIGSHLDEIYGSKVSAATISRVTGVVTDEVAQWQSRPLDTFSDFLAHLLPRIASELSATYQLIGLRNADSGGGVSGPRPKRSITVHDPVVVHHGGMRFLTLNTWGTRGEWEEREARFRDRVEQLAPDIVTLQERVQTPDAQQARRLLGDEFHFAEQQEREPGRSDVPIGQGITTASRWPFGRVFEVDLHLTDRTGDFAYTSLVTEVHAPQPFGRIWVANHFPDYQLDHERERRLQTAAVARTLEVLVVEAPGHVIIAGDMDADADADSIRFLTGRHVIDDLSVCYRDSWESIHSGEPLTTYAPSSPYQKDPDWPFRGIDHILVRCAATGPTLLATSCERVFDLGPDIISDHYGLTVDYQPAPPAT